MSAVVLRQDLMFEFAALRSLGLRHYLVNVTPCAEKSDVRVPISRGPPRPGSREDQRPSSKNSKFVGGRTAVLAHASVINESAPNAIRRLRTDAPSA